MRPEMTDWPEVYDEDEWDEWLEAKVAAQRRGDVFTVPVSAYPTKAYVYGNSPTELRVQVNAAYADTEEHAAYATPVNGGEDGWRAECQTCGTVLRCLPTEAQAVDFAAKHYDKFKEE